MVTMPKISRSELTGSRPARVPGSLGCPTFASWIVRTGAIGMACGAAFASTPGLPTYRVIDLTAAGANAVANSHDGNLVTGFTVNAAAGLLTRAALWRGGQRTDLHPAFLDEGTVGRSMVEGNAAAVQVGWGFGAGTANVTIPIVWRGTAASASPLPIPFAHHGGQALGTDGHQIVGFASPVGSEGAAFGPSHALVWDAATGEATDLGDGGGGAQAMGVHGGQQVGYVVKGNISAALWTGSERSLVPLHPLGAETSTANATDGSRQVGYAGYDVRVRNEAAHGNKYARFNYATVWTGTAASAVNIHPTVSASAPTAFAHSYAVATAGGWIVGYAAEQAKIGTPAYNHAIVWDANFVVTDLNAFLPTGFVGAQANSVDADGRITGMMSTATGERHAVVWVPVSGTASENPVPPAPHSKPSRKRALPEYAPAQNSLPASE